MCLTFVFIGKHWMAHSTLVCFHFDLYNQSKCPGLSLLFIDLYLGATIVYTLEEKKNQKIAFESGRIMSRNYFQHNTLRNISFRANDDSGCILASNARVFRVLNSY